MKKRLLILFIVGAFSMVISLTLTLSVEAGQNPKIANAFDAFWWWIVTSTTVGNGDVVPVTKTGKIVAIFSIIMGFYLYTNRVAIVVESVHSYFDRQNKGTVKVTVKNHISEYTAMADELIFISSRQVMEHVLKHVPFNPLTWLNDERRKRVLDVGRKKWRRKK